MKSIIGTQVTEIVSKVVRPCNQARSGDTKSQATGDNGGVN
jgi:hypothetical protein